MYIEKNDKFLLTGDSVTDCGRAYPLGEGNGMAMGDGYPRMIHAILDSFYPERHIRVINTGISGNTSRSLRARWQKDILDVKPDWVSVMIGINDIWRQFDLPLDKESHVYLGEFKENINYMVENTLPLVKGMILVTPCFMEQNHEDPMRKMCDEYAAAVKETAHEYNTLFTDAQQEFDRYFRHYNTYYMSCDRVHPNHVGHMLISKAILHTLNFDCCF